MTKFWFVTGDTAISKRAHLVLDAWLAIEIGGAKNGTEFTREANRTIEAYTANGQLIARKTWEEWHEAVMQDTYGDDWQDHCERAERLL